jgi:tRNA pseudouridine55 synthase
MGLNGILNVNKPAGPTSFSIVAHVRRLTGEKRVGHAGTLDPAACGVLPVCLGQATRITEYLHDFPKEYLAAIQLGTTTDSCDAEGRITSRADTAGITLATVQETLKLFEGLIDQVPPAFSAIKVKGRQSYDLARAGIEVDHQPRRVRIDRIELLAFEPPCIRLAIICSKGTYIRSLARDLGEKLGCGAFLKGLVRSAYGPFKMNEALSTENIRDAVAAGQLASLLYPVDYPLTGWGQYTANLEEAEQIMAGVDIAIQGLLPGDDTCCRVYHPDGRFLAVMNFRPDSGLWHPHKVFHL